MDSGVGASFVTDLSANDLVAANDSQTKLIIIVDKRPFVRECLRSWITVFGQEFGVVDVADVGSDLNGEVMRRASAVILSAVASTPCNIWLQEQVQRVLARRPDVPIALIAEPSETAVAETLITQLSLRGCIPTSSSAELAVAVLRLIVAGGSYIPRPVSEVQGSERTLPVPVPARVAVDRTSSTKLTPRERSVMDLLRQGMPNKLIAYRLGMAQSTVKVHVHNIITKLNVRNRTEAAVTGHADAAASPQALVPPSRAGAPMLDYALQHRSL
jgi:DNA-binding NarL/FixJ family response regulator